MINKHWEIIFYKSINNKEPVKEWLKSLELNSKITVSRTIQLLQENGLSLKAPYVKNINGKLYELRAKDDKGIYRILYFAHTNKQFILLHGFTKKTQKTPQKEIKIANKRMKEFLNG